MRKPRSTRVSLIRLCIARPPPASSDNASANSTARRAHGAPVPPAADRGTPAVLQHIARRSRALPATPARSQTERPRARDEDREQQHRNVQRHVGLGRQGVSAACIAMIQRTSKQRQANAEHAPEHRQDDALRRATARTDGRGSRRIERAHRDLTLTRRAARQHQIGDVDARDQQHETDRAEEQPQRRPRLPRQEIVLQRLDAPPQPVFELRIRRSQLTRHRLHVRVRLRQRHVVFHAPHDQQPVEIVVDLIRRERERDDERRRLAIFRRQRADDADDSARRAVDSNLLADDVRILAETLVPQPVPQHDHRVLPGAPFLFPEIAPEDERHAKHVVEPRRRPHRVHLFGTIGGSDVHRAACPRSHPRKDSRLSLPLEEIAGGRDVAAVLHARPHHDQLIGFRIRQRREQRAVDDAEDGSVGTNAQRQCQ